MGESVNNKMSHCEPLHWAVQSLPFLPWGCRIYDGGHMYRKNNKQPSLCSFLFIFNCRLSFTGGLGLVVTLSALVVKVRGGDDGAVNGDCQPYRVFYVCFPAHGLPVYAAGRYPCRHNS